MESPRITIRLPKPVLSAAEAKASKRGESLGVYIRSLVEADTGVAVEIKQGFAANPKALAKAIRRSSAARKIS